MNNNILKLVTEEVANQIGTEIEVTEDKQLREELGLPSIKMVMLLTSITDQLGISIMDFNDYELLRLKTVKDLVDLLINKRIERIKNRLFDPNLILENDRVRLQIISREEIPKLEKIACDPAIWEYFTIEITNDIELANFVEEALMDYEKGNRVTFVIIDKLKNCPVGMSSLGNISMRDMRLEIGWSWLGTIFQGTGINRSYKELLLQFAFEELDFVRVEFKTDILNTKARKALVKIGATEEGILRSHTLMTHNRRRDTIYYSVLNKEWESYKEIR